MKLARLFAILALLTGSIVAEAKATKPGPEKRTDLTDFLSPEELVQEFGFNPYSLENMLWKSSTENPRLHIIVDKAKEGTSETAQTLEAYVDGVLAHRFIVSTGKEKPIITPKGNKSNRVTNVGTFRITWRSRYHVSKEYTGASMPFAQFFDGGIAIHATTPDHYKDLGKRDSGGCVRLHPTNAKIMWELVGAVGVEETLITVYDGSIMDHPLKVKEVETAQPETALPEPVLPQPELNEDDALPPADPKEMDPANDSGNRQLEKLRKELGYDKI